MIDMQTMRRIVVCCAFLQCGTSASAEASLAKLEAGAIDAATAYSQHFLARDLNYLVLHTVPRVSADVTERGESMHAVLERVIEIFLDGENPVRSEEIGVPTLFSVDAVQVAIVPTMRNRSGVLEEHVPYKYMLFSWDRGGTWFVYDNACFHREVLRRIAPSWSGTPSIERSFERRSITMQ